MRKLFKKRLLGIPVAVLLVLALTAGVAAGYAVIQGTVTVQVVEALEVEYSWDNGTTWHGVTDGFTYTVSEAYPGECHAFQVRIKNYSSSSLWVTVTHTEDSVPEGGDGKVTIEGVGTDLFDGGICIPGNGTEYTRTGRGCVAGDAPAGDYKFSVSVTRDDCNDV